ncbi:MAG: hypothetical protein ABWW69_06925 [Pyrodictiaceae archaeon]
MSVPVAIPYPAHEVGFEANVDASEVEVGRDKVDIEITVYVGFDEDSERLINEARKAASILSRDYGYIAIVVPVTIAWNITSVADPLMDELPALVINGYKLNTGKLPSSDEIVDAALALLYEAGEADNRVRVPFSNSGRFLDAAVEEV